MTNARIQCLEVLWFRKNGNLYKLVNVPEDCALDLILLMYECGYSFVKDGSSSTNHCVRLEGKNLE